MSNEVKDRNIKKKKNNDIFKIILILILIASAINLFLVKSKEIILINDPDRPFTSDCRGLAYFDDEKGERAKAECLKSIEQARKKVTPAKEYLENYKSSHIIIAFILSITTVIILVSRGYKNNKSNHIVLAIFIILLNLATIVIKFV